MLEQIKKAMANRKKGLRISLIAFPVMFGLCGVIFLLTEPMVALKLRGLLVCLGGTAFAELSVLFLAAGENKKFNAEVQPVLKHYHFDI
jgi:Flp pilus assembly protein TadB